MNISPPPNAIPFICLGSDKMTRYIPLISDPPDTDPAITIFYLKSISWYIIYQEIDIILSYRPALASVQSMQCGKNPKP